MVAAIVQGRHFRRVVVGDSLEQGPLFDEREMRESLPAGITVEAGVLYLTICGQSVPASGLTLRPCELPEWAKVNPS